MKGGWAIFSQISQFAQNIPVGFFRDNSLMVPLWQMSLYTLLIAGCLLWRRYRLGLSISFIFCFYWGFIANRVLFIGNIQGTERFSWPFLLYLGGGLIVIAFSVFSFFISDQDRVYINFSLSPLRQLRNVCTLCRVSRYS